MTDVLQWVMEHGVTVLEAAGLVLAGASLIAGLTPTPKDDEVVRKAIRFLSFLRSKDEPGTLKTPLSR